MFIIDCIPEFTQFVLPRYFKHCKFPSFVRQLNIYGFQRDTDARKSKDTKDKESCRWYHPCFRPDRGDLFHLIRRKATRYSRKRKTKASNDDDPETILNLGSADESELDEENQENMILIVSNDEHDGRRSSSASSATQSMQPIDYDSTSSQLQLGFQEPVTVTTTTTTTTTSTNSPRILNPKAIPLTVDTNINMPATNDYHAMATPTLVHSSINTHMLQRDDLPPSDNADDRIIDNGLVVNMQQKQQQLQHQQHFEQQQKLHQPLLRGQELRLQLYHMKQHYEKMHAYFKEQLSTAQIQIDEQQIRIQHLEGALGITKQSVKQSTIQEPAAAGGYMSTHPTATTVESKFACKYTSSCSNQSSRDVSNAKQQHHNERLCSCYNPKT
ncbi:HSF-type DNA-binding-domain-containing protein [Parasitella parasitica]|nr:HSF-type DNA-binding-domain-containing protein [Parasitella parasitica]